MGRFQKRNMSFIFLVSCLLGPSGLKQARADAKSDVSVATTTTCANGSSLYFIVNANVTSGLTASVAQTVVLTSGKTVQSTLQVSLNAGQQKTLGCAVQDPPPAKNVQYSWQIQSAVYN